MKCKICKEEHGINVFTVTDSDVVADIKFLRGVCYYCYQRVPKHIPKKQVKRWLYNAMRKL